MSNIFKRNQTIPYELRNCNTFRSRRVIFVKYDTEAMLYLAPIIWSIAPEIIKNSKSLELFKLKIRKWSPKSSCSLCKTCLKFVLNLAYFEIGKTKILF